MNPSEKNVIQKQTATEEMLSQLFFQKLVTYLNLNSTKSLEESKQPRAEKKITNDTHTKIVRRCESHGCQVASTRRIYVRQR